MPVADALGGGWRPGLAVWAIPAAVAAAGLAAGAHTSGPGIQRDRSSRRAIHIPATPLAACCETVWPGQVTLFFALQSGGVLRHAGLAAEHLPQPRRQ